MFVSYIVFGYCMISGIVSTSYYMYHAGLNRNDGIFTQYKRIDIDVYPVIIFTLMMFGWIILPLYIIKKILDDKKEPEDMPIQ